MSTPNDTTASQGPAPFAARVGERRIGEILRGERETLGRSLLDVQRDLKIRAIYIDAIENADVSVFPNKGFVCGYVRSYARYLGLDPEAVSACFRAETGLREAAQERAGRTGGGQTGGGQTGGAQTGGAQTGARTGGRTGSGGSGVFRPDFPLAARPRRGLPLPSLSALGSVLGLAGLLAGLGYGGWTVLQNVQRVQFAPVEEAPAALATIEGLPPQDAPAAEAAELGDLARPVAAAQLAELYRKQELEVPILAPRDGPIAALDPEKVGLLAQVAAAPVAPAAPLALASPLPDAAAAPAGDAPAPDGDGDGNGEGADAPAAVPGEAVTLIAERAAWIRVYRADKTVIFEKILETGETYALPVEAAAPLIWAGNSGSVYVRLGETLRGPLGSGTRAVRDVSLDPAALAARLPEASQAPEVVSRAFDPAPDAASVALQ